MESNLRPLTLSEILDRTAQLYRENFLLFAGIFAVYSGVALILGMPLIFLFAGFKPLQPMAAGHMLAIFLAIGVVYLLLFLFFGAATAAITRAVAWVHLGEPASIQRAYTTTLPRLGRYIWLKIIVFVMVALVWLGGLLAGFILVTIPIIALKARAPSGSGAIFALIIILLYIPSGFLAVWMALRYSLAIPASVVENIKARKAIRRSVQLSKESRGRIFVLWLMVGIVWFALFAVTQGFFVFYSAAHQNNLPIGLSILQQILNFFVNTLVGPLLAIGSTLFYYDQRVRKEGYDIEWMMQAAGLTVPEAPPVEGSEPQSEA